MIRVLNIMESLGIGGGQSMMYELSNGLNKYCGDRCQSIVAGVKKEANAVVVQPKMLETYGIPLLKMAYSDLDAYCTSNKIDIVVHHRVSISTPLRKMIPERIPYVVISHTAASLSKIADYYTCASVIVSVCNHLHHCSPMTEKYKHKMTVILNGIENDFINKLEPMQLKGGFKTGRCHRLVPTKFALNSLGWFESVKGQMPGHIHYLMGSGNKALPNAAQNKTSVRYVGEVVDKNIKFQYIKSFDMYFYEIMSNEGASIAVLEALACGVPVVCLKKGGIKELVHSGTNGFIEKSRNGMLTRMLECYKKPDKLKQLKEQTLRDFNERLHVRHCARKYMDLFEKLVRH